MEGETNILKLSEHDGVDRLNNLDQFLRQFENEPIVIDVGDKDLIPTPVLQTIISASLHWSQRDLGFSIVGVTEAAIKNLDLMGADLSAFINEEAAE